MAETCAAVHSVSDRLAYGEVVERRHGQVDEHGDVGDGREPVMVVRALGGVKGLDVGDELGANWATPVASSSLAGSLEVKAGYSIVLTLGRPGCQ